MNSVKNTFKNNIISFFLLFVSTKCRQAKKQKTHVYQSPASASHTLKLVTDIHESHYLRFARFYSLVDFYRISIIFTRSLLNLYSNRIRMLTNHTFALTTPSWNRIFSFKVLDKVYQMLSSLSTKFMQIFSHYFVQRYCSRDGSFIKAIRRLFCRRFTPLYYQTAE